MGFKEEGSRGVRLVAKVVDLLLAVVWVARSEVAYYGTLYFVIFDGKDVNLRTREWEMW